MSGATGQTWFSLLPGCPTRPIESNQNLLPYREKASESEGSGNSSEMAKYHEITIYTWLMILFQMLSTSAKPFRSSLDVITACWSEPFHFLITNYRIIGSPYHDVVGKQSYKCTNVLKNGCPNLCIRFFLELTHCFSRL